MTQKINKNLFISFIEYACYVVKREGNLCVDICYNFPINKPCSAKLKIIPYGRRTVFYSIIIYLDHISFFNLTTGNLKRVYKKDILPLKILDKKKYSIY